MSELSTKEITYLPGVGPKKAELLKSELKIQSYEDLLYHFPYKYVDRSRTFKIREIDSTSSHIQLRGKVVALNSVGQGKSQRLVARFADETGEIELVWFKFIKQIKTGIDPKAEYIVFGKPSKFNQTYNIVHPEMEKVDESKPRLTSGLQAFYNTTERMKKGYLNSKGIQKMQQNIFLSFKGAISETLPAYIVQQYKLMILDQALRTVHFPPNSKALEQAQFRLKFEELFYIQLSILKLKNQRSLRIQGHIFANVGDFFNHFFYNNLPLNSQVHKSV
ncbi:OB-fold nucleic acid binding domain-containing protein [Saccharicrinis fermentans]|uniref:ATP-dependent DNA helicase RecG n=1 Tax=Saccharicrinis fermentans DSM 9555 = JCM 21142 TaxID=869213 RepID=W7YQN7_9BACT|nr:OB-fold nucleic acid binding domain-containing protein [Saccharicrinis fermentans]GAF04739.1 ATP-dependent DNA helicase RecG [Saccharicrinis fermentans DSM 9555 = JCM 21142]